MEESARKCPEILCKKNRCRRGQGCREIIFRPKPETRESANELDGPRKCKKPRARKVERASILAREPRVYMEGKFGRKRLY